MIEGASADGRVKSKQDVIELALAGLGGPDRARTVIVGDRLHDMEGAARCGISAVGVLWGFGSREELSAYSPRAAGAKPGAGGGLFAQRIALFGRRGFVPPGLPGGLGQGKQTTRERGA